MLTDFVVTAPEGRDVYSFVDEKPPSSDRSDICRPDIAPLGLGKYFAYKTINISPPLGAEEAISTTKSVSTRENEKNEKLLLQYLMTQDLPHILVADDDRSIRGMLKAALGLSGFRTTSVSSGREAIEAARQTRFDAVLCDIFMPDGDGLEVTRELRVIAPETPILLVTAQGSVDLAVQALSEGASDFIA